MDETGRLRSAVQAVAVGPVRGFFVGVSLLGRGLGMWMTSPRLMMIGAIPALIVAAVYTALVITLIINLNGLSAWLTPFANEWDEPWRTITRFAAAGGVLALAVLLFVYTFVAITLTVGDPFYERIWQRVEQRLGNPPAGDEPFWTSLRRGVGNGLRLLATTVLIGLGLFALGFIPLVGQTVVPVLGAFVGGWFLAVELTGFAFDARRMSLRERRRILGARRSTTLGFGVATYLLFLVPFAAVFVMPAAVVGATLLSRRTLEESQGAIKPSR
ncbi:EI24 domain-containing protein [Diaminobutyricimonas sp. LJ205]|uniref:EI24 domain-containing protein n=1 Tax=Diaminobutyricimonas sp. LJ205 TaxID=2683590 RepID=UPI0012F4DC9B|nr:EI24 domain-containing protein [Diaminobutyricimonas sp. LJ205]